MKAKTISSFLAISILIAITYSSIPELHSRLAAAVPKLNLNTLRHLVKGFQLNHKLKSDKFYEQLSAAHFGLESSKQQIRNMEQKVGKLYSLYERLEAQNSVQLDHRSERQLSFEQKYRSHSLNDLIFRVKRNLTERQITLTMMKNELKRLSDKTRGLVLARRLFYSNNLSGDMRNALFFHFINSQLTSNRHMNEEESDDIRRAAEDAVFGLHNDGVDENVVDDENSQDENETESRDDQDTQASTPEDQTHIVQTDDGLETSQDGLDQSNTDNTALNSDQNTIEVTESQQEPPVKTNGIEAKDVNESKSEIELKEVQPETQTVNLQEPLSLEEKDKLRESLIDEVEKAPAPNLYIQYNDPQNTSTTEEAAKVALTLQRDSLTATDEKRPLKFDLAPLFAPVDDKSSNPSNVQASDASNNQLEADKKEESKDINTKATTTTEAQDKTEVDLLAQPINTVTVANQQSGSIDSKDQVSDPKETQTTPEANQSEPKSSPTQAVQTQQNDNSMPLDKERNQNLLPESTDQNANIQQKLPSITDALFNSVKQFENFLEDKKAQKQVVNKLEDIVDNFINFAGTEVNASLKAVKEGYENAKPLPKDTESRLLASNNLLASLGKSSMHKNPRMEEMRPFLNRFDRNVHLIIPKSDEN